jgi:DNA-binding ferritin-like protein (Dps family)
VATIKIEPLPFEEAIRFFETKLALTPDEYQKLYEEVKLRAFTVSGITSLEVLNDILTELQKATEEGLTPQEFRK